MDQMQSIDWPAVGAWLKGYEQGGGDPAIGAIVQSLARLADFDIDPCLSKGDQLALRRVATKIHGIIDDYEFGGE